jgi:preprotein translocase subunit SecE
MQTTRPPISVMVMLAGFLLFVGGLAIILVDLISR